MQVLDRGPVSERLDIDGPERQPGFLECRHDVAEMGATAHQYGDSLLRILRARRRHQLHHALRLLLAASVQGMDRNRLAGERITRGDRR